MQQLLLKQVTIVQRGHVEIVQVVYWWMAATEVKGQTKRITLGTPASGVLRAQAALDYYSRLLPVAASDGGLCSLRATTEKGGRKGISPLAHVSQA